ncbi:MAG: hypothetical protein HQ553_06545 [Chloroflexi bacterium]|nr:hypothetical protein [Chloroflexota bacterium]
MTDTIESFVTKLKSEGVEEGKRQADQLRSDAQQQAEQIVADAKRQAEKIIADANAEAESMLARSRTEMELAARDATLKLRDSLEKALQAVLTGLVESQLNDAEFLRGLIQSIVSRYLEAEIESYAPMKISVSPEMHKQLTDWAIEKLRISAIDDTSGIDLKGELRQAGFEFSLHGATIEVTKDSIVDTLMQLVSPSLREVIRQANQSREGT